MQQGSRRRFLRDSLGAAGAAALSATPARAASSDAVAGANDRIRVGLIGCGGQGRSNLKDFVKVKNVECVALCDVDDDQVAKTQRRASTPPASDQKAALTTRDFRRVLDAKDVDAVIVGHPGSLARAARRSWPARRAKTSTSRSRSR